MLDLNEIDTLSYAMVKVDIVHDNLKDLKLEVPLDNMMLTMRDVVARRVQWRWTSIDVDPSAATSVLTSPALMFPKSHLSPSPNPE
jgi:hypothetical protein